MSSIHILYNHDPAQALYSLSGRCTQFKMFNCPEVVSECAGSAGSTDAVDELEAELRLVLELVIVDALRVQVEHGVVHVHVLDVVVVLSWITEGEVPAIVVHGAPAYYGV